MVPPVLMIPGFSGSVLVNSKHPYKTMFHKRILDNRWLNVYPYSPNYMKRWKHDMKCDLKIKDNRVIGYTNINHDIEPYDLYGIHGIQNIVGDFDILTKSQQDIFNSIFNYRYFHDVNKVFLEKGYVPGHTLIGFPWDFRFVLDPLIRSHIFNLLQLKIESVVREQQKSMTIIAHSLGGVLIKWFLEDFVKQEWQEEYIAKLIFVNVPFGGTPNAVKAILIGDYFVPFFNNFFVEEFRHNSGIIMGLPNGLCYHMNDVHWYSDEKNKSITIKNYYEDQNISYKLWRDLYVNHLINIGRVNHIPTTIFNSSDIETPACFWSKTLHDAPYKIVSEDGDGMIPTRSLNVGIDLFPNHKVIHLPKTSHTQAISHPKFLEYVKKLT